MSSDAETSFNYDNREEEILTENRIPRSPAIDAYESYASWRKKKFPSKTLDYKADSCRNPPASAFQKSSYFPTETRNSSGNYSHCSPTDSALPRSTYFSLNPENVTIATKNDSKIRLLPFNEDNHQKYDPKLFQTDNKEFHQTPQNSPHITKNPSPVNKISKEAQHYLKVYSKQSDNLSSPSNIYKHTSQTYETSGNLRTRQKEFVNNSNSKKSPIDCDPRLSPNVGVLQPVRYKSDHRHSFPSCCSIEHKSRETDNTEMVKGLLKLIDNQNEQIRNLQAQLDRLLKIHEETLKEKVKCICSLEVSRQNPQICLQTYNAASHTRNSAITAESCSNQNLPTFHESNQMPNESLNRRNVQFEDHTRKTMMERKVSIGVMTSFEFTVQNSPFNFETENEPIIEEQHNEIYREGEKNPSNVDLSRKKQNLFSLMPSPLENIIEDSESHLSSSQQPSSNYLSSCKSGNLQIQNGRNKVTPGNNSNNTHNHNFNMSNSPSHFNHSNENSLIIQNLSNGPNIQNRGETRKQNNEIRNQVENHAGRDFPKQNSSPVNKTQQRSRETISISKKNGNSRGFEVSRTATRSPDIVRENQNRRENQDERFNKENVRNEDHFQDESLVLSGGQLEVKDRIPPSPEPSIHLDMQEYSSEEGSVLTKKTPKVGWTFYNNVLGQVNHILQNSPIDEEVIQNEKISEKQELDKNVLMETVKAATIDQLRKLGISFVDNNESKEANRKVTFDTSYISRLNPEMNMMQGTSILTETNTSLHMKALAMKYLKEDQVCDVMQQKQRRGALKNLMLSNVQGTTNMSFATMRYLQRYQLLPESMNGYVGDEGKENLQIPQISENQEPIMQKSRPNLQNRPVLAQTTKSTCPSKILDISTLKQQPKLL